MVNPIFSITFIGLFSLTITACATLSKEECLQGNWQAIGYNDGVAGRYPSYIGNHQKACAKVNVTANHTLWQQGREQGLKQYCTKANAYQLGINGTVLNKVCPAYVTGNLQSINQIGLKQFKVADTIQKNQRKIKEYKEQLKKLKNGDMLDFKTEKEARVYMLSIADKIKALEKHTNKHKATLTKLQLTGY